MFVFSFVMASSHKHGKILMHTDKLYNVLTSQLTLIMYFGAFYIKEMRTEVKREVLLVLVLDAAHGNSS